ncbi:hypothetical protein D3C78_1117750 [compost metagenome]
MSNDIPYRGVSNKIVFTKYGSGANPIFTPRVATSISPSQTVLSNLHFLVLEGGSVFFRDTDILMPNALQPGTVAWNETFGVSLFSRAHGGSVPLQGSVTMAMGNITLGARNLFKSGYAGNYRVDISNAVINASLSSLFADLTSATMALAVYGVEVTNGKTWADLVRGVVKDPRGGLCNFMSNIGNQLAGA